MAESVYKVIELIGTSTESWEKAAQAAIIKRRPELDPFRDSELDPSSC